MNCNNFLYYSLKDVLYVNNTSILITFDLNHVYCEFCFEVCDYDLCFVLLITNTTNHYYACFLMMSSLCLVVEHDIVLQLIGSNSRALSLYLWLGLHMISTVQICTNMTPYLKLKNIKSKTKNMYRRYLIP